MAYYLKDADYQALQKEGTCSKISYYKKDPSRICYVKLAKDLDIADIPCKAGYPIFFDYDGNFEDERFIILARDVELWSTRSGTKFPYAGGTPLNFGYHGRIEQGILSRDFKYHGITFKARTKVTFQTWDRSWSSDNPKLWTGFIKNDEIIDGYPCLGGTEVTFAKGDLQEFHPSVEGYKDYKGKEIHIGERCVIWPD